MENPESEWHILSGGAQIKIVDRDADPMPVELVNCSSKQDFGEAIEFIDQEIVKQEQKDDFQAEEKRVYEKMVTSGLFAFAGAIASCHWPVAIGPTLIYCAELGINCREYKKLPKLRDLASSIANLEKPVMSGEGEMKVRKQLGIK